MLRRSLLLRLPAMTAAGGLSACASNASTGIVTMTSGQIVSDINTVFVALQKALPGIQAAAPNLIPANIAAQVRNDLLIAEGLLPTVSTAIAATVSAPSVQKVELLLNAALTALATIPGIPPPYSMAILAASILLPMVETYAASYIPAPPQKTMARPMDGAIGISPDQARNILGNFLAQ